MKNSNYVIFLALIVSLGGFLFGFDAAVIAGALGPFKKTFPLTALQNGWLVSSPTFSATITMLFIGPISDRLGRKKVLISVAFLYAMSALLSAMAPGVNVLVFARMMGGIAFGAALILAPMYIAEIAPAKRRGQMVSINQLNIVLGFSAAYFANYYLNNWNGDDPDIWRWMLGLEFIPAIIFFIMLFFIPESPRWLIGKGREQEGLDILQKVNGEVDAKQVVVEVKASLQEAKKQAKVPLVELFKPAMKMVLLIGIIVGVLQQITGINCVFFYANTIFEQSGIGSDAAFTQAIWVGLINVIFTFVAMALIDRLGRKPLLLIGVAGVAISMFIAAYGFSQATYTLTQDALTALPAEMNQSGMSTLVGKTFTDDVSFKTAVIDVLGQADASKFESDIIKASVTMNPYLILIGILGFVASFAISLGPVMWVLFSEIYPNWIRGLAISVVGFINSAVSFGVQFLFPLELAHLGTALTFAIYGMFAIVGFLLIAWLLPETKGKTLEQIEKELVGA